MRKRRKKRESPRHSPARCLEEAERLFLDFKELTPFRFRPLARTFSSFREYERWKRAQENPRYR